MHSNNLDKSKKTIPLAHYQATITWLSLFQCFLLTSLLFSSTLFASRNAQHPSSFIDAYERITKGELINDRSLIQHPLYPYLAYKKITLNKDTVSDKTIKAFILKYPNSLMAEKLWVIWLKRLSKQKKWDEIIKLYNPLINKEGPKCLYYQAKIALNKNKKKTIKKALSLWLTSQSISNTCNALFDQLRKSNDLNKDHIWKRIDLAIAKGNTTLVKILAKQLAPDEEKLARLLAYSHKYPNKALRSQSLGRGRYSRRVISHSIKRLARKNTKKALKRWKSIQKRYPFTTAEKAKIDAYFAYRSAFSHQDSALQQFINIPKRYRDDHANIWMARSAIRQGNWKRIKQAIQALSEKEKQRDIWRYWLAKAYSKSNQTMKATLLFKQLTNDASFYGFLSADLLNQPYRSLTLPKNTNSYTQCLSSIQQLPSVKRALAWFKLDKNSKAKKEWYWTLEHLNKEGQLTMAAFALQLNKPVLAISTVSYTKDWNQVQLRFPMLYKSLIQKMAKKNNVSPAWVYGIMRRESIFNPTAQSSAKAMGLMQILPSTARYVAKKLGFEVSKEALFIPSININLGSAYLNQMLNKHKGNYVKATASYNAGPSNVSRWKPKKTIPADQWVESIPFTETRKYVRAVMSYTTIYDYKLNQQRSLRLSERLSPVTP